MILCVCKCIVNVCMLGFKIIKEFCLGILNGPHRNVEVHHLTQSYFSDTYIPKLIV